jgi:plastocyanin
MNTTIVGHKVKIERDGNYVIAKPNILDVKKGDTLQIISTDGRPRVEFNPWPFAETEEAHGVESMDEVLTFEKIGDFTFLCYLAPTGEKKEITYYKNGGNGNVRP